MDNETSLLKKKIELIKEKNKEAGRDLTAEELIEKSDSLESGMSERDGLDSYLLIHLTDYLPKEGLIKPPIFTDKVEVKHTSFGDFYLKSFRNTTHFGVCYFPTFHEGGDWREKKNAIIIPLSSFVSENKDAIVNCNIVDFFARGVLTLPADTIILSPVEDVEEVRKINPNITVIGYSGEKLTEVVPPFMSMLGYKFYSSGKEQNQNALKELLEKKTGRKIDTGPHSQSIDDGFEKIYSIITLAADKIKYIKNNNLLDTIDLTSEVVFDNSFFERCGCICERDDPKEVLDYITKVDNASKSMGISALQFVKFEPVKLEKDSNASICKRVKESIEIDRFIGKDIEELYDTDMLITNIKRVQLILERIEKENLYRNEEAMNILNNALSHLHADYKKTIILSEYRMTYDPEFELGDYLKKLDEGLKKIGINHRFLEQDNLDKLVLEEIKTQHFIKKNFPNLSSKESISLDTLSTMDAISSFIVEGYKDCLLNDTEFSSAEAESCFRYLQKKLLIVFDEKHLIKLRQNSGGVPEFLSASEMLLEKLGVSVDDLIDPDKRKNISSKMNASLERKLDAVDEEVNTNNNVNTGPSKV